MKLYLRLLWMLLTARRRGPCSVVGPCSTEFRVWPNDLDVYLHMNNGVYLTIADLGRTDMLKRAGVLPEMRRLGWYPVVAAESIRFHRSLKVWQRFRIDTRVIGWNERSIYLEQRFISGDETVAQLVIDARFLIRGGGKVTPQEVLEAASKVTNTEALVEQPLSPPSWVDDWSDAMRAMQAARV